MVAFLEPRFFAEVEDDKGRAEAAAAAAAAATEGGTRYGFVLKG